MFIGSSINESPVMACVAGAVIENGAHKAVKMVNGKVQLASAAGERVIGLLPSQTPEKIEAGGDVTVQIMARGKWIAGGAVDAGAQVATDASGRAVKAATGNVIVGIALSAAAGAGAVIDVLITHAGQMA